MNIPAPSASTPDSLDKSNGLLAWLGSPLCGTVKPLAIKAATVWGVRGASAPPAIANSASPERILETAIATASNPEGHAEETVAECARAPIRSAIAFAAASVFNAPIDVGHV